MRFHQKKKNELGASMLEFSITVGLLMLLATGTVELGRLVSQISWFSQTAYQAALVGSEYNQDLAEESARDRFRNLYALQNKALELKEEDLANEVVNYNPLDETFTFRASAAMPYTMGSSEHYLGKALGLNLNVDITAPALAQRSDDFDSRLQTPESDLRYGVNCRGATAPVAGSFETGLTTVGQQASSRADCLSDYGGTDFLEIKTPLFTRGVPARNPYSPSIPPEDPCVPGQVNTISCDPRQPIFNPVLPATLTAMLGFNSGGSSGGGGSILP